MNNIVKKLSNMIKPEIKEGLYSFYIFCSLKKHFYWIMFSFNVIAHLAQHIYHGLKPHGSLMPDTFFVMMITLISLIHLILFIVTDPNYAMATIEKYIIEPYKKRFKEV
jgi:hypothetical protein